jgi:hypothetical protein
VAETLTPENAAAHLCELSADARAAVLLDDAGQLVGSSEEGEPAEELAGAARELLAAIDAAAPGDSPEQVEAQVDEGAVYMVRRQGLALAVVARRSALSSLMFYDARSVLAAIEGAR